VNILRTYPQPDSPAPHLRARERAMAVYKYLMDLEPGEATKHPRFAVIVHAFEQSERKGWNEAGLHFANTGGGIPLTKELDKSYCDELSQRIEMGEVVIDTRPRELPPNDPFTPDGI
jgi:hypothetical protein